MPNQVIILEDIDDILFFPLNLQFYWKEKQTMQISCMYAAYLPGRLFLFCCFFLNLIDLFFFRKKDYKYKTHM